MSKNINKIGVIGLGYVGAPLACALANHYTVVGFDVNQQRIEELLNKEDKTGEITAEKLGGVLELKADSGLILSSNEEALKDCNMYII